MSRNSGQRFICFLVVNDQKFDIVIERNSNSVANPSLNYSEIHYQMSCVLTVALRKQFDPNTCILELFDPISNKTSIIDRLHNQIKHLSIIRIIEKPSFLSRGRAYILDPSVSILRTDGSDITGFNSIVKCIHPDWNFHKNPDRKWKMVSDKVAEPNYLYNPKKCMQVFNRFSTFYVENYDKLNYKLDPELQLKFDELKIVHTLNIRKVFVGYLANKLEDIVKKDPELQLIKKHGINVFTKNLKMDAEDQEIVQRPYKHLIDQNKQLRELTSHLVKQVKHTIEDYKKNKVSDSESNRKNSIDGKRMDPNKKRKTCIETIVLD